MPEIACDRIDAEELGEELRSLLPEAHALLDLAGSNLSGEGRLHSCAVLVRKEDRRATVVELDLAGERPCRWRASRCRGWC